MDPWSPDALRQAQAVESEVGEIVSWQTISDVALPWSDVIRCSDATKEYWNQWELLELKDGYCIGGGLPETTILVGSN